METGIKKTRAEIIAMTKAQLKGKWRTPIIVYLIYWLISQIPSLLTRWFGLNSVVRYTLFGTYYYTNVSLFSSLLSMIITGPIMLGLVNYFIKVSRNEQPPIDAFFSGAKRILPAMLLHIISVFFVSMWSILFVIPGIWALIKYSQAYFILNDYPNATALEAINTSKKMMTGHVGEFISLVFMFFGWFLLAGLFQSIVYSLLGPYSYIISNIGFFIVYPYFHLALANYYENLKASTDFYNLP